MRNHIHSYATNLLMFWVETCGNPIHEPAISLVLTFQPGVCPKGRELPALDVFSTCYTYGPTASLVSYAHNHYIMVTNVVQTALSAKLWCLKDFPTYLKRNSPWLPQPPKMKAIFFHKLLLKGPGSRGYSPIYDPMLAYVPLSCSAYVIAGVCWKHLRWCESGCLDPPGTGPATTMLGYSWFGQHAHLSWQGYYD